MPKISGHSAAPLDHFLIGHSGYFAPIHPKPAPSESHKDRPCSQGKLIRVPTAQQQSNLSSKTVAGTHHSMISACSKLQQFEMLAHSV